MLIDICNQNKSFKLILLRFKHYAHYAQSIIVRDEYQLKQTNQYTSSWPDIIVNLIR